MYDGNPGEIDFGSSHRESTVVFLAVFYLCKSLDWEFPGGYPWGGQGPQQSFIRGGSVPRSNPLPLLSNSYDKKGTSFVFLPLKNGTPLTYLV